MDTGERTESKNQHFVPQMLLRGFAVPETRGKAVAVLDTEHNSIRPRGSIRGQCAKAFLYGEDGITEKKLQNLEGNAANIINGMITGLKIPAVGTAEHARFIDFIAAQYGRTPAAGRELNKQVDSFRKRLIESAHARGASEWASRFSTEVSDYHKPELESLIMAMQLAPCLFDLKDALVVNETEVEFAISDIGIALYNHWTAGTKAFGTNGFTCKGLIFFLPISSRHLFVKYDPYVYLLKNPHSQIVRIKENSLISALNRMQILFAERNVYFTGHEKTKENLQGIAAKGLKISRESRVHSQRFVQSKDPRSELVIISSESPKINLNIPWLTIRKKYASIPLAERCNKYRPSAVALAENLGLIPRFGNPPTDMHGTWFRRSQ